MPQLDCVEVNPKVKPTASVIWLHGLGSNGHDFEAILPELKLPASSPVRFIFPHAPSLPVTVNGG
ncbi:alpha/beta hydrolase, partial [Photobacterium sp. R1]